MYEELVPLFAKLLEPRPHSTHVRLRCKIGSPELHLVRREHCHTRRCHCASQTPFAGLEFQKQDGWWVGAELVRQWGWL